MELRSSDGQPDSGDVHRRREVSFEDCDMLTWSLGCTGCRYGSGAKGVRQSSLIVCELFAQPTIPKSVVRTAGPPGAAASNSN
jgi:hypothetical protein